MKKSIATQQTPTNIAAVLTLLTDTPTRLETLSTPLPPDQLRIPLGDGERSFTEDLAHLINCEARTSEKIYMALLADEPFFLDIHPERHWGKLLHHEQEDFADLLAYFKFRRRALLRVLNSLTEAQWSRVIREENKQRKESVYWQARSLALHELEHLTNLANKLAHPAPD